MIKTAPPPDTHVCEVCQSELGSQKLLQTHKLCHFNSSHVCYACDNYFVHADTLVLHMATVHRDLNPAGQAAIDEGLVCSICLQKFSSQNNLVKHQNIHLIKDGKSATCRVCGVEFVGATALMAHLTNPRHMEMKLKMQSVFVCVDCRSIFASRDSYAMHMMMRAQDEVCKGPAAADFPATAFQMNMRMDTSSKISPPQQMNIEDTSVVTQLQQQQNQQKESGQVLVPDQAAMTPVATLSDTEASRSSPLNLSTHNSSLSGSPTSEPRASSAVINACSLCPSQFPTQDALALHMMYHARGDDPTSYNPNAQQNIYGRPNSVPLSGIPGKTGPSPWMCGKCLYSFDTCDSLAMHMMTKHANENNQFLTKQIAGGSASGGVMANVAEITKGIMQRMANTISTVDTNSQQTLFQKPQTHDSAAQILLLQQHHQQLAQKRAATNSPLYDENSQHEIKRRKSSQPMKKQWHCVQCEQTYHSKTEYDEHQQFCKIPQGEGSSPQCDLCSMAFPDMRALGLHLRGQNHYQRMKQAGLTIRSSLDESKDESENQSIYPSPRSVSSMSISSDSGFPMVSPLSLGKIHRRASQNLSSAAQSPESSGQAGNQWDEGTSDLSTQGQGQVSQSGLSPSDGNEQEENEEVEHGEIMEYIASHAKNLIMCKHCKVIYTDRTLYYLHMGLHNLNNPWQCNMCGKTCRNLHEFTSHVIHYKF